MVYSPNKRSDQDAAFQSHEIGELVDQTVKAKAIAAQISTLRTTTRPAVDFPLITTPVTTGFVAELADLPLSNIDTGSVTATAYKIAGATQVSSEMLDDLDPEIAQEIGNSLADQIITTLDAAVLGNTTANGPSGLLSLASTQVDPGTSVANTDPFVKAVYAARNATVPANVDRFVVSPATAQALSLLKTQTSGSNVNLLEFQEDGTILVAGVPLLVANFGSDTTTAAWAVDSTQSRLVLRKGTEVTKTYVPQNDSWFISAIARWGWVNLAPASVVRIFHSS